MSGGVSTTGSSRRPQANAAQGYVALLAVDLYHGKLATDPETAHELSRACRKNQGVRDLVAGFNFLAARKDVDRKRIGAVGWCMGGGFALQLAIGRAPLSKPSAINYGALATDTGTLNKIHAACSATSADRTKAFRPMP